jgi:SPX domain protein involved in polyphosphate accumulation
MQNKNILKQITQHNNVNVEHIYNMIHTMIHEHQLTPAVQVQYERLAFQPNGSKDLRVTLDRDVRFRCPQRIHRAPLQGIVLEIKYNDQMPEWMSELREILGLRRIKRFSKFARSIRGLIELRETKELL